MRIASKILHRIHFLDTFFYQAVKIFLYRLFIRIFRTNTAQFSGIRGNRNNFDRRIKGLALLCTFCLIDLTEGSFTDLLHDLPFRPYRNRKLFVHLSSLLSSRNMIYIYLNVIRNCSIASQLHNFYFILNPISI